MEKSMYSFKEVFLSQDIFKINPIGTDMDPFGN